MFGSGYAGLGKWRNVFDKDDHFPEVVEVFKHLALGEGIREISLGRKEYLNSNLKIYWEVHR